MHFSNNIDLVSAILGGIIIGISSTGFLLASGKLTGISGFVENTISPAMRLDDKLWSISYVMGLVRINKYCSMLWVMNYTYRWLLVLLLHL